MIIYKTRIRYFSRKVEPFIAGGALDKYAILRYLVSDKSKAGDIQYLWDRYIDPAFNNLNLKITENPKAEDAIQAMKKGWGCYIFSSFS